MRTLLCAALVAALAAPARADIKLPTIFTSHMVLQRDKPIVIWGWAEKGEKVTATLGEATGTATADDDGNFTIKLAAAKANDKGQALTVKGNNTITIEDVLIGDVWVGSGQSNMEWSVNASADPTKTAAAADHPTVRLYHVPKLQAKEPTKDIKAEWKSCTPKTIGNFSAALYHFGVAIQKEQKIPIGLINSSWGGSRIEPWTVTDKGSGGMYNAMIAPISKFPVKGVIWYQGESNMGEGMLYRDRKEALIKGWRKFWGEDMPFFFVQIAPFSGYNPSILLNKATKGFQAEDGKVTVPLAGLQRLEYRDGKLANTFEIGVEADVKGKPSIRFVKAEAAVEGDNLVFTAKGAEKPVAARYNYDLLPYLWEAQTACLKIPNTGMIVVTDAVHAIGDIHPKDKLTVGNRLALWALAKTYGKKDVVYSGPLYKSVKFDEGKATLTFAHVGGGLKSRDDKDLTTFEIAGDDGKFFTAKAKIEGETIVVSSDKVAKPANVRFGWSKTTNPNLCNKEGLPAGPFQTKDWKGSTGE